jgi:hypothetical protein
VTFKIDVNGSSSIIIKCLHKKMLISNKLILLKKKDIHRFIKYIKLCKYLRKFNFEDKVVGTNDVPSFSVMLGVSAKVTNKIK